MFINRCGLSPNFEPLSSQQVFLGIPNFYHHIKTELNVWFVHMVTGNRWFPWYIDYIQFGVMF